MVRLQNDRINLNLLTNDSHIPLIEILQDLDISSPYLTEDQARYELPKFNSALNVCVINIRSLPSNFTSLKAFLDNIECKGKSFDVLLLQETFEHDPFHYNLEGYDLFSTVRSQAGGGGTAIYINNSFVNKQIHKSDRFTMIERTLEATVVKCEIPNQGKMLFVSCYHPPSQPGYTPNEHHELFLDKMSALLAKLSEYDLPILVGGDFNMDLLKATEAENAPSNFARTLATHGFLPYITRATRIERGGDTYSLLDNILLNKNFDKVIHSNIIVNGLSDHFIPTISLNLGAKRPQRPMFKEIRVMNTENKDRFKEAMSNITWNEVLREDCPNRACDNFLDTFLDLFELFFPTKRVKFNKNIHKRCKFMTKGLLVSRKRKIKLQYLAKNSRDPILELQYRNYKNLYNKLINKAKKLSYNYSVLAAGSDTKKIWGILKDSINLKKSKVNIGPIRDNDGNLITQDNEKADVFNQFFSQVGMEVASSVPKTNTHFSTFLPPRCLSSIYMAHINPEEMRGFIKALKSKASKDVNGLSTNFLQFIVDEISIPLSHIFNLMIETGIFPERLKTSRVVPIFKGGDHLDVNNYRGVSLIDNLSKIMEKAMATKFQGFLDHTGFYYENQFGFRPKMSTSMAVTKVMNFLSKEMNKNKHTMAIFLDIKKAFDSVDRNILYAKLDNCGIRGPALELVKSYFQNRKQKVTVNGTCSDGLADIPIGVLQGSILGVLFFVIFINDLQRSCTELLNILFADDNTGLLASESLDELICKGNEQLDMLFTWYSANKLAIHPGKSRVMIFHPPSRPPPLPQVNGHPYMPLYINFNDRGREGETVLPLDITKIKMIRLVPNAEESSFKLLGVLLDKNLSLKEHVKGVHNKISRSLFAIKQMKKFLDKEHLLLLANAYIKSHLEYCNVVFTCCNKTTLKPLEITLKKTVRAIQGVGPRDHTAEIFKELNILPLADMINYSVAKFMHKFYHDLLPETFNDTWNKNIQVTNVQTRQADDIRPERFHLNYFKSHPFFAFPDIWNTLPIELKNIVDEDIFATRAKKYFHDNPTTL